MSISTRTEPEERPGASDERGTRLRRANVRLAVALGLFAAALYVGFVLTGVG